MNLWADLDDNQLLRSPSMEQGRTRRSTEQVLLSSLRAWLLHDYAAAYSRSLAASRIFRRCYWIDALGLAGKSTSAMQQAVLQPVLELSRVLTQESKPITLYGLLLMAGSSKRKDTHMSYTGSSAPAKELILPKESSILSASWLELAPALLNKLEQAPAIFLLNPFSPTLFNYDDLAPLYQRTVPTELLLLVPHRQVAMRLANAQRVPAQATLLTTLLRSDKWKTLPSKEEQSSEAVDGVIELLIASMQRHFVFPVQRLNLPVQTRPAVVELLPYTLLFATRRQDSLISMNDALYRYRRFVYEQSHRGVLGAEWFGAQQRERYEQELQHVEEHMVQLGKAQRIRHWPDLRQLLLLAHFGQFPIEEYNALIVKLLARGEVRCEWRNRPDTEEQEPRVPENDDTLLWR